MWNLTPTSSTPTCLWINDLNGAIYIGMENGITELIESDTSIYQLKRLDIPEIEEYPISDLFRSGGSLVIRSTNRLLLYSREEGKITSDVSLAGETTEGAFMANGQAIAFDGNGNTFNLNSGKPSPANQSIRKKIDNDLELNLLAMLFSVTLSIVFIFLMVI